MFLNMHSAQTHCCRLISSEIHPLQMEAQMEVEVEVEVRPDPTRPEVEDRSEVTVLDPAIVFSTTTTTTTTTSITPITSIT